MKNFLILLTLTAIIGFSSVFSSCKNKNDQTDTLGIVDTDSIDVQEKIEQAKEIFYSLPAPHEVATFLMLNDDAFFAEDILNPVSNSSNYNTEAAKSFNLGVFSADLSYASLYDQNQIVINYMAASKKLAEQLGILDAFSQQTIERLEQNINNRDEIMRIISETFMDSDAFLQENDRQDVGALILIGGWVEGIYLAVQVSGGDVNENTQLVSSILEQQLSLELMVQFLKDFQSQKLDIVSDDLIQLYDIYNQIETSVTDDGYLRCTQDEFDNLCEAVKLLRNKIVNLS
ncbi:MAG: hypothetical protein JXR68_03030 [Bacteroidales bacterium]|nr:hypothetical protein [Bacteroidales bacterium]